MIMPMGDPKGNFAGTGGYGGSFPGAGGATNQGNSGGYGFAGSMSGTDHGFNIGGYGTPMGQGKNGAGSSTGQMLGQALMQPPVPQAKPVNPAIAQSPLPAIGQPMPKPPGVAGFGVTDPYPNAYSNVYAGIPGPPRGQTGPYAGGGPTSGPGISGMGPVSNMGAKGGFGGGINPNKGNFGGL